MKVRNIEVSDTWGTLGRRMGDWFTDPNRGEALQAGIAQELTAKQVD